MATNKLKAIISFMREINDRYIPDASDYELEYWEYWDVTKDYQDEGLISEAIFAKADGFEHPLEAVLSDVKLIVKGDEHLPVMKDYKGIKGLQNGAVILEERRFIYGRIKLKTNCKKIKFRIYWRYQKTCLLV